MTIIEYLAVLYIGLCVFRPFRILMSFILGVVLKIVGWFVFLPAIILVKLSGLIIEMGSFLQEGH